MITTSDGEIYEDETAHALGVKRDVKPVTLAMNMENIQPSKRTQVRNVISDALTNFHNSLPKTDPLAQTEGMVRKESPLSNTLGQGLTKTFDKLHNEAEGREFNALNYQKRLDDWVNSKTDDPLPDPF